MIPTTRAPFVVLFLAMPHAAFAQTPPATESRKLLNTGHIDALVSPILLYPDALLSEILMASTYPLEVAVQCNGTYAS